MKNRFIIMILVVLGALIFTTCKKEANLPIPDGTKNAVVPLITKDLTKDANISFINLGGFVATIIVDTYYDELPESMNLMVSYNNDQDTTGIVKSNITTFPDSTDVSISSLLAILPGLDDTMQLSLNDYFKFYVDITLKDGTIVRGNDTLYSLNSPGIANLPNSSLSVKYTISCEYDTSMAQGNYTAYSAPDQWDVSGNVTLEADSLDPYTIKVFGLAELDDLDGKGVPLIMHINPLTYEVTVDETIIVVGLIDGWGYHNLKYGGSGEYNTCTGTYEMKYDISVDEGGWGLNEFTLTRN